MDNPSDLLSENTSEGASKDRFNNLIAISVAVLATFMSVAHIKADNVVQAMAQAKSDAVDTWAEYQAKRIRNHTIEVGLDELKALRETVPRPAQLTLDERVKHYESETARYQGEQTELQKKARDYEDQYQRLNYRDDQFDLSEAALSVSIALLAVSALIRKKWLLFLAMALGVFGLVMGIAGFAGWNIHPDGLIRLLT